MSVVFDGPLSVAYSQAYVFSADGWSGDMANCFQGQRNGLLGAVERGFLFLTTGLHTGRVHFVVRLHDGRQVVDEGMEEIVEASFAPLASSSTVREWPGSPVCELALNEEAYRVRYSAKNMDAARAMDTLPVGDEPVDAYVLEFWPEPMSPDNIVKQSSEIAAYWHRSAPAMRLSPPQPPQEPQSIARRGPQGTPVRGPDHLTVRVRRRQGPIE